MTGEVVSFRPVHRGVMTAAPMAGGGWHFGSYPSSDMVFVEGRLAPMLSGDASDRTLTPAVHLPEAVALASARIASILIAPRGPVRLRRADLAADIRFQQPEDGLSTLRALACMDVPRYQLDVWRHDGTQVATIYLRTPGGRVRARIYDKARERGDVPGTLVRAEYQHQPVGVRRPAITDFVRADVAPLWRRAFGQWAAASSTLTAGTLADQHKEVLSRARGGELTGRVSERLLGSLTLISAGLGDELLGERAVRRRRSELRQLGIAVGETYRGEIAVGEIFQAICASFAHTDAA